MCLSQTILCLIKQSIKELGSGFPDDLQPFSQKLSILCGGLINPPQEQCALKPLGIEAKTAQP